jgi:amidase
MSLQLMSVQGPLAREVADVRAGFEIMAQPSPDDPWHIAAPIEGSSSAPRRVAATYGAGLVTTDHAVRSAIDQAAAHLSDAGYDVDFVDPPDLEEILAGWQSLLATETMVTVHDQLRAITSDDFQRILGWMFDGDILVDLAGYIAAMANRTTILRRWTRFLAERPIVLAPVSQQVPFAPNDDATSKERFTEIMHGHASLVAVNYLGLPSVAVPVSLLDDGPIGVQLIGRPFREDICLDAAQAIEERVGVMAARLWDRTDGPELIG